MFHWDMKHETTIQENKKHFRTFDERQENNNSFVPKQYETRMHMFDYAC